ncbi:HNH endonuclease signature motif containing protein [Burkholderia sp. BCC0405]|uniref:HNH endonuclease n=1 Tax=Burkholderia sp. BCC0405 TaxID=2676298 RepID=UPI00158A652D|nr:HNH endonuclease signature motif containing protein [Burkholderia sp. BCC0405]
MADAIVQQFKTCTSCKSERRVQDFAKKRSTKDGLRPECRQCQARAYAEYAARNKERISAANAAYYKKNKARKDAAATAWQQANRLRENERRAILRADDPESFRINERRRRARKKGAEGSHTKAQASLLLERQNFRCANCEDDLRVSPKNLDHWMPLTLGGSNYLENLQWLCKTCNVRKNAKDPIDWLVSIGKACRWPDQI